jgi:hypothetical protein
MGQIQLGEQFYVFSDQDDRYFLHNPKLIVSADGVANGNRFEVDLHIRRVSFYGRCAIAAAPAQQVRVLLAGLDLDDAREVHRHHGGDVGDAEAAAGDEVAAGQAAASSVTKNCCSRPARARPVPGSARSPPGRAARGRPSPGAVAQRLGHGHQALELDAPVPAGDLGLLGRRDAQQRRLGKRASAQAVMAALSVSSRPSSVRSAGTVHCGLMAR